jgi:two-component system NtrC family sensor kinase
MLFTPYQSLLAIALFEAGAIVILLVLYLLFQRDFHPRFFRFWVAGWTLYTAFGLSQILEFWQSSPLRRLLTHEFFFAGSLLLVAAVLEHAGRSRWLAALWPIAPLGGLGWGWEVYRLPFATPWHWALPVLQSGLYLSSGWILWRHTRAQQGRHGAALLAGVFLLHGLHGLDRAVWAAQPLYLLRVSFGGLLEVTLGIAMAVLVLEAAHSRTEDLNDKLRQLTLITAASTQSMDVNEVLQEALAHLVGSLNATHGVVRLFTGRAENRELEIRAAVGFTEEFLQNHARVSVNEPWAGKLLEQGAPFFSYENETDPALRQRMEAEKVSALVLMRLPGKEAPLGVLGIGSTTDRRFQADEVDFLVNVANLLSLTIQNVWLFEQVANAQGQWAYTFDSIGDPILVHDPEFQIIRVNKTIGDRLGRAVRDLIGRPVRDALGRGTSRWKQCPYCEGTAGEGDDRDPSLGGHFLVSNSDFHDPFGHRLGTIHVLKDVTDRKRAEEKYRNLFENVQEGVFISTPAGHFVDFNDAFMHMLGYEKREELLQVDIASTIYVNPADRERLKKLLREHGAVTAFEFTMRRRDGEVLTVLESSFATRDATGAIVAYQGFVLDITERKLAEQEIRRRNRELMVLNSIGQTLTQPLEFLELMERVLRQVVELFGVDLASLFLADETSGVLRRVAAVGLHSEYAKDFPPTTISPELLEHFRSVRATVLPVQSLPLPPIFRDLQHKEGIKVSLVVLLWSKDRIIGGLSVGSRTLREFSTAELNLLAAVGSQLAATIEKTLLYEEARQAYENLRRTQEQLLQSGKMAAVGQLISGVAHELNNPLTAILGYSQLLSSSPHITSRDAGFIEKLHRQTQRTHRIVQNLLSFARQHKPERLPVRLNQVLEDALALREYDLRVNNIQVHRELATDLQLTAGDAHRLQQVFLNILNNAVDAILGCSQRGEIWVRTGLLQDGRLFVEFTDSGPGAQEPSRVFDPFYTTKPVGQGTGLGLSICYGIVTEHGGEISVRNSTEPGCGAIFTVTLPVLPAEAGGDGAQLAAQEILPGARVLLVDDEEVVLELQQEMLKSRCLAVTAVRSGREAQRHLEREAVDLVVTDLKMPGEITGRALYDWIRCQHPGLSNRVVFTVSDAQGEGIASWLEQTGCLYVQKPFEMERFLGVLRQALRQAAASPIRR